MINLKRIAQLKIFYSGNLLFYILILKKLIRKKKQ